MMMMAAPRAAAYQVPSPYAEQGYVAVDAAVIFTDLHTMKNGNTGTGSTGYKQDIIAALKAKPDNSELKAAAEAAKALKEKDYTKDSYKAVKSALKAAEKVLKDKKASQSKINEALAELNEAVDSLETAASKAKPGKKK